MNNARRHIEDMKQFRAFLVACALLCPVLSWGQAASTNINPAQVGFYAVELVCPAAPQIGCGSAAKPILLALEHNDSISAAWLNRAGTMMAVEWRKDASRKQRLKIMASAIEDKPVEVKGAARKKALEQFITGNGWYRSAEVDQLSAEEAVIIARRLVRRMNKLISMTEEKTKALEEGIAGVMKEKLTNKEQETRLQTEEKILGICRKHLNEEEIAVLKKAHDTGVFSHLRQEAGDGE